jgi:hypothetical protein
MYDTATLQQNSKFVDANGDTITITKLQCYISNVNWHSHKKEVYLVNLLQANSIEIHNPYKNSKSLHFTLGVDSLLNCSGPQTGALDPLNNMFWTWHSGYIFFKLEAISSNKNMRKIEQHIGGYKTPYNAIQQLNLPLQGAIRNSATIVFDLKKYWPTVLQKPVIGAPSSFAVAASQMLSNSFYILKNEK